MVEKIIPKDQLKEGWYRGHSDSRFEVAYWDSKVQEFVSLSRKFDKLVTKHMNHWDDEYFAAFGPVERLSKKE